VAEHIWQSQDGAWDNVASWSSGAVPAGIGADTVLFTGASQHPVVSGLDNDAITLVLLRVQPEYRGDIGNEQNPLKIGTARTIHKGSGRLWHEGGIDGIQECIVNDPSRRGSVAVVGGVVGWLYVVSGEGIITAGVAGVGNVALLTEYARVQIGQGAGPIASVFVGAGRFDTLAGSTALYMRDGIAYVRGTANHGTWIQVGGVTIDYVQGGTLGTLSLLGGRYDTTRQVQGVRTISDAYIFPEADFRYVEQRVTITNLHDMTGDELTKAV